MHRASDNCTIYNQRRESNRLVQLRYTQNREEPKLVPICKEIEAKKGPIDFTRYELLRKLISYQKAKERIYAEEEGRVAVNSMLSDYAMNAYAMSVNQDAYAASRPQAKNIPNPTQLN